MQDVDLEYFSGRLAEAHLEIGRLRTALDAVLTYSNDPGVIKMVQFALDQSPVLVSEGLAACREQSWNQ